MAGGTATISATASCGPNFASTLNQSAFSVGDALGPTLGAAALALGFDYRALPWIGSALALLCAATALFRAPSRTANRFRSPMDVPARLVDGIAPRSDA